MPENWAIASAVHQICNLSASCWTTLGLKEQISIIADQLCKKGLETIDSEEAGRFKDAKAVNTAILHWLRNSIMGGLPGPSMVDTMVLLGRKATVQRLEVAKGLVQSAEGQRDDSQIVK